MKKIEFGDFQTPKKLAKEVIELLSKEFPISDIIIEPTCGLGNFIEEANLQWKNKCQYYGFEINEKYYKSTSAKFSSFENIEINLQNFFSFDWNFFFNNKTDNKIAIIGNPPWVNNSIVGTLNGKNLPTKSNFQNFKGFEAKMGKSNFDIAESIIIELVQASKNCSGYLAFLCKTATARKVLTYFWKNNISLSKANIYNINAKKDFNVSVEACLLVLERSDKINIKDAIIYSSLLKDKTIIQKFGIRNNQLISNLDDYEKFKYMDGISTYTWRSGIKHDASKVMELTLRDDEYFNGYGDLVNIEDTYLFPLLKSSDVGNNRLIPRKYVIVTQRKVGEDTSVIKKIAPKTWNYLNQHIIKLQSRKSSIYKNKPLFSVFGIGEYSFSNWKIGISGLYKNIKFNIIPPYKNKPMMLDDTCYFIPCKSEEEAKYWINLFNSNEMQKFLKSLIFMDAKRPITVDILKRIDMSALANKISDPNRASAYLYNAGIEKNGQASFVFESQPKYLTSTRNE